MLFRFSFSFDDSHHQCTNSAVIASLIGANAVEPRWVGNQVNRSRLRLVKIHPIRALYVAVNGTPGGQKHVTNVIYLHVVSVFFFLRFKEKYKTPATGFSLFVFFLDISPRDCRRRARGLVYTTISWRNPNGYIKIYRKKEKFFRIHGAVDIFRRTAPFVTRLLMCGKPRFSCFPSTFFFLFSAVVCLFPRRRRSMGSLPFN